MKTHLIEQIAELCHEANRAYCRQLGDNSQLPWDLAPEWQRQSCVAGVTFKLNNPEAGPDAMHNSWLRQKQADGWVYGETKDAEKKTHPCIVPYHQLSAEQKCKDVIFSSIVSAMVVLMPQDAPQGEGEQSAPPPAPTNEPTAEPKEVSPTEA